MESPVRPPQSAARGLIAAWSVHGLTASGAVLGLFALLATARGELRSAALLMLAAFAVDGVDGTLARAARVRERLPVIDGRRLDDVIDYLNYVIVPCFFLAAAGLVGSGWAALPALASAYQFAQTDAKTEDHFFLGFPSYWNFVALYAWLLALEPATTAGWLAGLSLLVFVPIRYVYPTRMPRFGRTMTLGAAVFTALLLAATLSEDAASASRLARLSLAYPIAYAALSLWLGGLNRGEMTVGVLLAQLGTPASPAVADVRRYLREFLSDPRVIDLPGPARFLLVNAVIAPLRAPRSARAYRSIWSEAGSPLLVHSRAFASALARELGPAYRVELGMRYGAPRLSEALVRLTASAVSRVVAFPLYPQAAESSSGSAIAAIRAAAARDSARPPLHFVPPFFAHTGFVEAAAAVARPALSARVDHVLFSYHGLPERHVRRADPSGAHCLASPGCCDAPGAALAHCYRAQCFATTRALASALGLAPASVTTAFQSRLGRTPWIGPATDATLVELARRGVRRLAVLCPSFVADCLETLEEIGLRGRETFRAAGGEELALVPCVNASPEWVRGAAGLVRASAASRTPDPSG